MKTRLTGFSVILALLCLLVPLAATAQGTTSSLIVKLVSGLSPEEQAAVFARNGGVKTSSIAPLRLHVVEVPADQLAAVRSRYRGDLQVESVEENTTRSSEGIPSDALYSNQWALPRIGWDAVYGTIAPTGTATVAILDTGVDGRHPDLAGKVISGVSILDGSDGTTDPSGHGTWLAGIVAANTGSLEGIAGVGYAGVRVVPVTVLDANGIGRDSDIIAGVVWAADRGAGVILMAFSATGFSAHLQDALDYAWSKGAVLVAAVGNAASSDPTFPAGHRGVMGVAATDPYDRLAPFSNEGQSVFIAAPGTDIQTTDVADAYVVVSGTSTAAAHVAGVAGFMRAVDPTLSNGVIVGRLARTADPASAQSQTGNGRLNMARALEDTSTEEVRPAGAAPVGEGGPFVGPYVAAAPKVGSVSVSAQSGALTSGTPGSATYTVTVNRGSGAGSAGAFTATLSVISALPSGATASFSPNPVSFTPAQTSRTATLTITTSAGTPGGSTAFDVKAQTSATDSATGSGTLTIGGKTNQTITFGPLGTRTYGDPDFTVSATASSGLTVAFTSTTPTTCTVSAVTVHIVAAGTCTIRASQAGNASFNAAADVDQSFTIAQKAASVTPNAGSKIYGDADPALTGALIGFLAGDGVTATYSRVAGETVGTYTISATLSPAGVLGNYDITYNTASLTITRKAASVTPNAGSKIYGDADPTLTGTLTGFLASDGVTGTYSRAAGETVGTYTISATLSPAGVLGNYDITYNTASLTITRKAASVTPSAASKIYGDADPTLTGTLTGFLASDGVTGTYSRAAGETVGTYTITASLSPATVLGNYDITYNTASLTITRKAASVTPSAASKIYGDADPTLTGTPTGFLAGDSVTAAYSRTAGETVGTYTISATLSPAGVLGNYDITYNTASLTITRKAASVTPAPASKIYGSPDPSPLTTGTLTGFLTGDGVTATYSRAAGETVGTYTISATLSPAGLLSNYYITYNTASLTITRKAASVTPNAASKIYGDADPTLTGTLTGFLATDGVTAAYSRTAGETVGIYALSAMLSPAGVLGNYAITYGTATFTIGKAALIVTTDNKSRTYYSPNPPLTGSIIGIKFADTITASRSTTATLSSGVGTYPITAIVSDNGSGKLANYTVTNTSGALTVLAANGTVTYTGLLDYTTASSNSSTAAVSSSAFVSVSGGDITTAKVVFTATPIAGGAPQTCTASVGVINATTGSASCTWTGSVGAAGGQSYTVTAVLTGNYTGPSDLATVNVHLPNQTNFITGGGQLVLTSNQVGKFAGDVGSKANLGLNVKYNKAGTNLQGNLNIIVRRGTTIFHFKSNVLIQLNVDATKGAATFTSKATAETWDAVTPTIITSLGGNFTIQIQMHDVPNSGPAKDTLGITIWDGSGALVFSSYWDAITKTTKEQAMGGGNLQVH